ncbi:HAD-IA family hydrolase [Oleispirillum naphthae]|uniref:HAD-IA family hydrolase n=1 Tax=Oleispirillum naphthae TaxID=2838853 RepID=UPI0030822BDB
MATKLVVFDVDGTLVDSAATIVRCMTEAFIECGREPPEPAAIRGIIGLSLPEAVGHIVGKISPQFVEAIVAAYKRRYQLDRETRPMPDGLFPGALACLDALEEAGCLLALATGKSRRGLLALMQRHGLLHRFAAIGTADDGPGKPDPFMLHKVMAEAGAEPAGSAMVGDTVYDIAMARAARVAAFGVAWGNHDGGAMLAAGARAVAPDFAALTGMLFETLP